MTSAFIGWFLDEAPDWYGDTLDRYPFNVERANNGPVF
jgi:hypothetical protein